MPTDKDTLALRALENDFANVPLILDPKEADRRQKLYAEIDVLRARISEKQKTVYGNAFEWRFEFPEVLDDAGNYVGFDVVIGNPPYIRQEAIKAQKEIYAERFGGFFCGTADLYTYFYKAGLEVLKPEGYLCYIAPNKFMRAGYGKNTRELLTTRSTPLMIRDFGDLPIFEEAVTYPAIVLVKRVGAQFIAPNKPGTKGVINAAPA